MLYNYQNKFGTPNFGTINRVPKRVPNYLRLDVLTCIKIFEKAAGRFSGKAPFRAGKGLKRKKSRFFERLFL